MSGEVCVPEEAIERALSAADLLANRVSREHMGRALSAAAPLILAAELERLAEEESVGVNESGHCWRGVDVVDLFRRAEELRAAVLRGEQR